MDIVIVVDIGIVNGDNDTFIGTFEDYINIIIILIFYYLFIFIILFLQSQSAGLHSSRPPSPLLP